MTEMPRGTDTPPADHAGHAPEAMARRARHELLGADLLSYQEEHGAFAEEEPAQARADICGAS
ncbi:hypothetical protein [Streptomyces sp. RFCAC02]|uniref:hypothetical protein n=1 Tax=Streptomyces sp. RFCAC02 TaxID=2499143 RepID=UPI001021000E|nr:hypothetical protein [Streptomyces sp. RFCAC02]